MLICDGTVGDDLKQSFWIKLNGLKPAKHRIFIDLRIKSLVNEDSYYQSCFGSSDR